METITKKTLQKLQQAREAGYRGEIKTKEGIFYI